MKPLSPAEITASLSRLPGWSHRDGALHKSFRFGSFRDALAYMQRVAPEIDRLDHHPEWTNIYDRVNVRLTSHDAGNLVTRLDVELAKVLDGYADRGV